MTSHSPLNPWTFGKLIGLFGCMMLESLGKVGKKEQTKSVPENGKNHHFFTWEFGGPIDASCRKDRKYTVLYAEWAQKRGVFFSNRWPKNTSWVYQLFVLRGCCDIPRISLYK
jgi:hypothetical protein